MNKVYFEDNAELAAMMYDHMMDGQSVALIADAETCGEVIADLFRHDAGEDGGVLGLGYVAVDYEVSSPFLLSVDDYGGVWCERAVHDERGMVRYDEDIVFVQSAYLRDAMDACYNDEAMFIEIVDNEDALVPDKYDEDEGDSGFEFIKGEDGQPCGFTYDDEGNGYCFHVRVCSCDAKSVETIVDSYNMLVSSLVNFMVKD